MNTNSTSSFTLKLDGVWTIARVAELRASFPAAPEPISIDATALEQIDLACLQCLLIAERKGRVRVVVDPNNRIRREAARHGLEKLFVNLSEAKL